MSSSYSNGRFIAINLLDVGAASISSSEADYGDYEVANIVDADPDLVYRTPATKTSVTLTALLDRVRTVSGIGLCAHNLSFTATVTINFYVGVTLLSSVTQDAHRPLYGAFMNPGAFNFGAFGYPIAGDPLDRIWPYTDIWPTPEYPDKVEIVISDPDNNDGYIELGYLTIGQYITPDENFDWGYKFGFIPQANRQDTPAGATLVGHDHPKRKLSVNWSALNAAEFTTFNQQLLHAQLNNTPIFWSGYPDRGGAIEDQHVGLIYPERWTPPYSASIAEGVFNLVGIEVYYHA